jgi:single-stranded-DNA-specific exonuclease
MLGFFIHNNYICRVYSPYMVTSFDVTKLHPITKILLEKRGVVGEKQIQNFLFPSYEEHVGDPFGIYGMVQAVDRITNAIRSGEKIAVYSDYDCDGVPGGVLLREFFDTIGYPVEMYIPHRHNEGYGIHTHAVDALKKKGVTLIITVDLAITNIEEIAYAKSVGVDFIVSDHHLPIHGEDGKQVVPDAVAVINSKQDLCTYHDDMLCGCAVAWKIACAVLSRLRTDISLGAVHETAKNLPVGFEKWMLDLVGISTISDMVPLVKENRALAHYGLRVLQKTKRPGLLHVFNEQRMKKEYLTEEDIAFMIAPRVNAASRMGNPIQAHMMLYEKDREAAEGYARDLELLNTQRKAEVKDIVSGIVFSHDVYQNDVVVVGDANWGPGILGLIAQKIIDETGKPVFVWGQGDDKTSMKGSCRSRGDVHVVDLMAHVGHDVFSHWGGHEQAGGFSVLVENIDKLSDALNASIGKVEKKEIASQTAVADVELSMDDINEVTYKAVVPLAPFGVGNPKPVFSFSNVTPLATKRFGKKSEHLEIIYPTSNGGKIKAIQFFVSDATEGKASAPHTLLANIEKSFFGFKVELRLRIVDIQ